MIEHHEDWTFTCDRCGNKDVRGSNKHPNFSVTVTVSVKRPQVPGFGDNHALYYRGPEPKHVSKGRSYYFCPECAPLWMEEAQP